MGTRQLLQILPTNLGDGVFSFRGGVPQIVFEISKMPKILNGSSLRINGTLNVYLADGTRPENRMLTDISANLGELGKSAQIDCRTGISSLFDYCEIKNLNGQTFEFNKSYNRMAQAVMPTSESFTSYVGGGVDATFGAGGKNKIQGRLCDRPMSFSCPLLSGMLQGSRGGLDLMLLQGLVITLQLQSPENSIQNNFWHSTMTDETLAVIEGAGAYFELTEMMLSAEVNLPSPQGRQAMISNTNGAFQYDSYNSYYTTIASADHSALLNINTAQTEAIVANLIPSAFLNNYNYPSGLCCQLLQTTGGGTKLDTAVTQKFFTFTKGGIRVPLDFELVSENTQLEGTPDSHKNYTELNTLDEVWSASHFLKNTRTELSLPHEDELGVVQNPAFNYRNNRFNETYQDAEQQYLVGVNYDHITDLGLNFKGTPVGIRIVSNMTSNNSPHSVFLFVKHQNTMVLRNGQVSILQ